MRVLTIDIDYISTDYARFSELNKFCDYPTKRWNELIRYTPYLPKDFTIDQGNFLFLIDIFTKCLPLCENVVFGLDHESILYELENEHDIDLINIDQHHDIAYNERDLYDIQNYRIVNEGSWIWYLYSTKQLKSYQWICTETSTPYNKSLPTGPQGRVVSPKYKDGTNHFVSENLPRMKIPFTTVLKQDITDWTDFKFDLIYVSESKDFVFPDHWFCADVLKLIYQNHHHKDPKQIIQRYKNEVLKHKSPS